METRNETRSSIRTRYVGPSNFRGSRLTVSDDGVCRGRRRRMVVNWDHAKRPDENHAHAARLWLARHIDHPTEIDGPGLNFDAAYFWTWRDARGILTS